ncbi:MAG: S-layer homology domain-containing protein [Clostridia bacterium]|nr:S-layer homology domain-containing protein [Clostridia bacterium]MDD4375649.1 S-layer homology domain-containing protein [Clostridia bacterium]
MKKIIRRIIMLVLAVCIGVSNFSVIANTSSANNVDVEKYHPYNQWAVETGIKNKIILFTDANTPAKRWEIANILSFLTELNTQLKDTEGVGNSYDDIEGLPGTIQERIIKMSNKGLIKGKGNGKFDPYSNVTRAEYSTMISRSGVLDSLKPKKTTNFQDVSMHWAKADIEKLATCGILEGKSSTEFYPEDMVTIQEVLIILDRIVTENCIKREMLQKCMTQTFECKVYSDDEAYIIETIYSKFDEVQNKLQFYWHNNHHYDVNNWKGLATYQDLVYALYFNINSLKYDVENQEDRETLQKTWKRMLSVNEGIVSERSNIKLQDLLNVVCNIVGISYSGENKANYENIILVDEKLKKSINGLIWKNFIDDSNYSLPLNVNVTKYILNYFIVKIFELEQPIYLQKGFEIETDISKMPANYTDYPLIIKGIPKEVYEMPFRNQGGYNVYTPKKNFESYANDYSRVTGKVREYFNLMLNVNYTTMDIEKFATKANEQVAFDYTDKMREYAQYVIDNKIILEGKAYFVPTAIYQSDVFNLARIVVEFKIISANERKNLLLGDFENSGDVWYTKDSYYFTFDKVLGGVYSGNNYDIRYSISYSPIIRDVYYNEHTRNEF